MRGLNNEERSVLQHWGQPYSHELGARLIARGLVVLTGKQVDIGGRKHDVASVTPLGELALRLDSAARGMVGA